MNTLKHVGGPVDGGGGGGSGSGSGGGGSGSGSGSGSGNSLLDGLNASFPMSTTGNETDPVHSYLAVKNGAGTATVDTAFGGSAKVFDGNYYLKITNVDFDWYGAATDFSIAIAFVPSSVTGNQIIFAAMNSSGVPGFLIRMEGTDLKLIFGDANSVTHSTTIATGLSIGVGVAVSFSLNYTTEQAVCYVNGVLAANINASSDWPPSTYVIDVYMGGWGSGQLFTGKIAAPHNWYRAITEAEQAAWYNSGTVQRLTKTWESPIWTPPQYSDLYEGWQAGPVLTWLYQSAMYTTPVTATAQSVGRWRGFKKGRKLDQFTPGYRPVTSISGGQCGLVFDGSDDYLSMGFGVTLAQPCTFYAVTSRPGTNQSRYIWDGFDGTNRQALIQDTTSTTGYPDAYAGAELKGTARWCTGNSAWAVVYNGASSKIRYTDSSPAVVNVTGNTGSNASAGMAVGCRYNQLAGSFAPLTYYCILVYNEVHDDTEIDAVLASLRTQFGAT